MELTPHTCSFFVQSTQMVHLWTICLSWLFEIWGVMWRIWIFLCKSVCSAHDLNIDMSKWSAVSFHWDIISGRSEWALIWVMKIGSECSFKGFVIAEAYLDKPANRHLNRQWQFPQHKMILSLLHGSEHELVGKLE